jgi:hypothetical protein
MGSAYIRILQMAFASDSLFYCISTILHTNNYCQNNYPSIKRGASISMRNTIMATITIRAISNNYSCNFPLSVQCNSDETN